MNLIDLFAGIGGFSLAAHWLGWSTLAFVEKDEFCRKVLRKNFGQHIDIYDDITTFSGKPFRGRCDVVTAGFPCQDISNANPVGKGLDGERSGLWKEAFDVIGETKPNWVVIENVANYKRLDIDRLRGGLADKGYETRVFDLRACYVGLPTMERHIWIVAAPDKIRRKRVKRETIQEKQVFTRQFQGSYKGERNGRSISESRFSCVAERVSKRLVRFERNAVEAYGNAIVPQIAFEIFKAIEYAENAQ